jgi:hypothetical protein
MKRIAIILDRNLEVGACSNVAALLMGQAALIDASLYDPAPLFDKSGVQHSAIKFSTVILKGGENQLVQLAKSLSRNGEGIRCVAFSRVGQGLHNAFEQYSSQIASMDTETAKVAGLILWGEEEAVRQLTKKYSVM